MGVDSGLEQVLIDRTPAGCGPFGGIEGPLLLNGLEGDRNAQPPGRGAVSCRLKGHAGDGGVVLGVRRDRELIWTVHLKDRCGLGREEHIPATGKEDQAN